MKLSANVSSHPVTSPGSGVGRGISAVERTQEAEVLVLPHEQEPRALVIPAKELVHELKVPAQKAVGKK